MRRTAWLLLLLTGCVTETRPAEPNRPPRRTSKKPAAKKPAPSKGGPAAAGRLPDRFAVNGIPVVEAPALAPGPMWRFLVSHLTTLRADARASDQDILVTFTKNAVHITRRTGVRRTWRLPKGLRIDGGPAHMILGADLNTRVFGPNGSQIPAAEEITVVKARLAADSGNVEFFRLVVKGGHAFRSISTPG